MGRQLSHDVRGEAAIVNVSGLVAQFRIEPVFLEIFVHVLVRSPRRQRTLQLLPTS
jgi:hypothetical protein